ncbi:hypothetical protein IWQ62_003824 [Dispira parvispora]|uniref:MFS transporter n=1 Tax=Dispira parvispora TaxID=1520584 RepID=A0A9W8AN36_9FUNG|nr:hypothetical protein IWQ62_003824 [Dispira parvispora]
MGVAHSWRTVRLTGSYVTACLSMLGAGTVYMFSLYGPAFKSELHFTAFETSIVASAGDYGLYISGPLWGYWVDRYGPRWLSFAAGWLLLSGYAVLSFLFHQGLLATSTRAVVVLAAGAFTLVGLGSQSAYMAAVATTAQNFSSKHRGLALGLPIGLFGLSAFFFSQVNQKYFATQASPPTETGEEEMHFQPAAFLLVVGLTTSLAQFVASVAMRVVPALFVKSGKSGPEETSPLVSSRSQSELSGPSSQSTDTVMALANSETPRSTESGEVGRTASLDARMTGEPIVTELNPPSDQTFFRDPQTLCLFLGMFGIAGTGLMYINQGGTVVDALLPMDPGRAMQLRIHMVSVFSLASFASRIFSGHLSDALLRSYRVPRITLLIGAAVIMTVAQLEMAYKSTVEGLDPLTIMMGIAYGAIFALCPTVTSEFWGTRHLGYHWGWMTLGPAIGGHLCNSVFGLVYDAHVIHTTLECESGTCQDELPSLLNMGAPSAVKCIGNQCFRSAFLTTATICVLSGIAFGVLLLFRLRQLGRY